MLFLSKDLQNRMISHNKGKEILRLVLFLQHFNIYPRRPLAKKEVDSHAQWKMHRFVFNLIISPTMVDSPILQHTLSDEISCILLARNRGSRWKVTPRYDHDQQDSLRNKLYTCEVWSSTIQFLISSLRTRFVVHFYKILHSRSPQRMF